MVAEMTTRILGPDGQPIAASPTRTPVLIIFWDYGRNMFEIGDNRELIGKMDLHDRKNIVKALKTIVEKDFGVIIEP